MHLVHTYIAYRVSNICSVYRSGLLMCRIGTVTCVCVTHTNPLTRYLVEGVCTLTHVLLLFLNYFMTGSHPPVYKTSLYCM